MNEKHLEFLQNNITRMNQCSFQMKGWAITIVSAFVAAYVATITDTNPGNKLFIIVAIIPTIITPILVLKSLVNDKIPYTNKTRPINEIMVPVMSKSFLDSVGGNLGILLCSNKIMITIINSDANPYFQLKNVVMTPPKSGPIAAAIAPMTPMIAKANVRFSPWYVPLIMETVAGIINAPATPSITAHPINNMVELELIAAVNVPIP